MSDHPDAQNQRGDVPGMVGASGERLRLLTEQQASLRRVATLVARGVSPSEVFLAVAEEMRNCLRVDNAAILRFENDGTVVFVCGRYQAGISMTPVGERWPLDGESVAAMVLATGRPARIDDHEQCTGTIARATRGLGLRCRVGAPIVVAGRIWGVAVVASRARESLPGDTEACLRDYADLVATAIANADARDQLRVLAEQQAALRRVATLVARGARPSEVFTAVAAEVANTLRVDNAVLVRYLDDGSGELVAVHDTANSPIIPVPSLWPLDGDNIASMVLRSGSTARMDTHEHAAGPIAAFVRQLGVRTGVGAPIVVNGLLWGATVIAFFRPEPPAPDTEARLAEFAELVATAIANAEARGELIAARDQLIASRARIVAAADDARRRLERDLHDGAQQRLVMLGLQARMAEAAVPAELDVLRNQLSDLASGLSAASTDLQEISRGIHPAILSDGGLGPALRTLARRCPIPANVDVLIEGRLAESVEIAAYYVVAEALTNAAKYANASEVNVCAEIKKDNLCLSIEDDGIGGADFRKGSGLIGLQDRVEVLGGHITVISPPGIGTTLQVTIPLTG
jgi:signal transduction histidine kinase